MEVVELWCSCKNPNCDYIAKKGYARTFPARFEGSIIRKETDIYFHNKRAGLICIKSDFDTPNSYLHTIKNVYYCLPCWKRIQNEKLLFPNGELEI